MKYYLQYLMDLSRCYVGKDRVGVFMDSSIDHAGQVRRNIVIPILKMIFSFSFKSKRHNELHWVNVH